MTKQSANIFIAGDWDEGIEACESFLKKIPGHAGQIVNMTEARTVIKKKSPDAFVFAVRSDSEDLQRRLEEVRKHCESLPVFVCLKDSDLEFAISLVKSNVTNVWRLPLDVEKIGPSFEREVKLYGLTKKIFVSGGANLDGHRFENMIGQSSRMQENFQMISAVAKSNATVLVTGESGVGKELVAKAIHRLSDRSKNKFVDINCGAIPRELLENELFGHEKGAFTGAHKRYQGSFEMAHEGSLFLDEISEMDVSLQVKLLRVLQERTFSRVGGSDRIKVDVRIIAATNRQLHESIQKGEFREDLYYRLNVINIDIPSLRERRDDIPLLSKHFLEYYSAKNNRIFIDFSNEAMEAMINYDWPGNVRELENTVERVVVLNDVTQVKLKHLPPHLQKVDREIGYSQDQSKIPNDLGVVPLEDLRRQAIEAALMKFQGNVSIAAKKLKIGQATLYRKVKKFGIVT